MSTTKTISSPASETQDAFTPGPWKTERFPKFYGCYGHDITSNNGSVADRAIVLAHVATDSGNDRANARLIAAAPELLAACRALLDSTFNLEPMRPMTVLENRRLAEAQAQSQAAIAKAEGTQP